MCGQRLFPYILFKIDPDTENKYKEIGTYSGSIKENVAAAVRKHFIFSI